MSKGLVWTGVVIVALIGGFFFLNSYIYPEKQGEGNTYEPYRATLSGEYLCLPHVDTSGPQTLECAFGLKLDDGTYYALDLNLMSQTVPDLTFGQRISASGIVTPIERLSTDHWRQYPVAGIFSVTDSLKEDVEGTALQCHDDTEYFVIVRVRDGLGEDILAKPKASAQTHPCEYLVAAGDVELTLEGPVYFLGVVGRHLLLDEGTAPPPRGLKVYDLKLRQFVYSDMYNRPLDITSGSLIYWQALPTPTNTVNCPEYAQYTSQGLGAGLERELVLTLSTMKAATTGKERCSARQ